jgi:hypothetical protein
MGNKFGWHSGVLKVKAVTFVAPTAKPNYGLDLASASVNKADVRLAGNTVIMQGAGAPVDGTTGDNFAGIGSLYIDTTNGNLYLQSAVITAPVWKLVTRAA